MIYSELKNVKQAIFAVFLNIYLQKNNLMIKHLVWNKKIIPIILAQLSSGHVLLTTTDTVLGLLASCTQEGFDYLNTIKVRQEKPYIVLVPDYHTAERYVAQEYHARLKALAHACWPGPVTVIFPVSLSAPAYMRSNQGTIGLRVPHHQGLLSILQESGPLFSTSANRAGDPVPSQLADVDPLVLESVSGVVLEESLPNQLSTTASTILDCTGDEIRLIRQGAFVVEEIERKAKVTIKR